MGLLEGDVCLERGLGYALPKARTARDFLDRFHDESWEALRPAQEERKSFILPRSPGVIRLQEVQVGLVRNGDQQDVQAGETLKFATVDQDATIIESHTRKALAAALAAVPAGLGVCAMTWT